MIKKRLITIDGPSASGKTTVSRYLAQKLSWDFLSTGVFYRGVSYLIFTHLGEDVFKNNDQKECLKMMELKKSLWRVECDKEQTYFLINNKPIDQNLLYESQMSHYASILSCWTQMRQVLLQKQRELFDEKKGLIAEGRDCGSVVFPQASLKVYLEAHSEVRAQRRSKELGVDFDQVKKELKLRDERDLKRTQAPLQIPQGALKLNTSKAPIEQIGDIIVEKFKKL